MNMLVFGGSGATGREVVKQALDRGYSVRAFVRDPGKLQIKHTKLATMVGNVTEYASDDRYVHGTPAVLG